jgi:hypothetical protein
MGATVNRINRSVVSLDRAYAVNINPQHQLTQRGTADEIFSAMYRFHYSNWLQWCKSGEYSASTNITLKRFSPEVNVRVSCHDYSISREDGAAQALS